MKLDGRLLSLVSSNYALLRNLHKSLCKPQSKTERKLMNSRICYIIFTQVSDRLKNDIGNPGF